jgi:predicted TIM-barrel fold metal-dependent hydrolase
MTSGLEKSPMDDQGLLDCDTHFTDHLDDLWAEVSPEFGLSVVPEVVTHRDQMRLRIGSQLFPRPSGSGQGNPRGLGHLIGPGATADRQEFMTKHRIRAAVLQPGFVGLSVQAVPDTELRRGILAAYNTLAQRACADSSLDLRWAVLLSAEDPEWSAEAVKRYRRDDWLAGAVIRPTARLSSHRLSDAALNPVFELLADERLCLFVHGGTGCYQWSPLADSYEDYTLTHAFGHMGEHMIALADLLTRRDGLPGGLRIVLLESGVSWLPSFLERLDNHVRRLTKSQDAPSELFRKHFAIVPDPGEQYGRWACEQIGAANILFGSDYPHWDSITAAQWFDAYGSLAPVGTLSANTLRFVPRLTLPRPRSARV